jgi:hypothetical protein
MSATLGALGTPLGFIGLWSPLRSGLGRRRGLGLGSGLGSRDQQAKTDRILHVTGNADGTLTYTTGQEPPDDGDPPF